MDKRNSISAENGKLPRPSSNDVGLITFVQSLAVLIVLVVGKYASKDGVEL